MLRLLYFFLLFETLDSHPNACFNFPIVLYASHDVLPTELAQLRNKLRGDLFILDQPNGENCLSEFTSFLSYHPTYGEFDHMPTAEEYQNLLHPKITYPPFNKSSPMLLYKNATVLYHGASSIVIPKHQFGVKFEKETSLLGLPAGKDWVLNGPFYDGSMLRNMVGHWLYRQTGRYSAAVRPFIMYLQNVATGIIQYQGMYLLEERSWAYGKHLGLATLTKYCQKDELSGGWIWQMNPYKPNTTIPNMIQDLSWYGFGGQSKPVLSYPKGSELTQTMRNYFVAENTSFLHHYFHYLHYNMTSPDLLETHIELGSFVDYILHSELILNQDAFRRSVWFHKDRYQTINAGPAWDMNLAMGIGSATHVKEWMIYTYIHWKRLLCNYKIAGLLMQRWKQLREKVWSNHAIRTFIETKSLPYKKLLEKCPNNWWRSNMLYCVNVMGGKNTYNETVEYLVSAVINRAEWMDQNITFFYQPLNENICGPLGTLPEYNCAADGSDKGCLTDPWKYSSKLTFPPKRKHWNGGECKLTPTSKKEEKMINKRIEQPSFDPCWSFPFCSDAGSCNGGPNAKCNCTDKINTNPFDCSPRNDVIHSNTIKMETSTETASEWTSLQWIFIICSCTVAISYYGVLQFYTSRRGNWARYHSPGSQRNHGARSQPLRRRRSYGSIPI